MQNAQSIEKASIPFVFSGFRGFIFSDIVKQAALPTAAFGRTYTQYAIIAYYNITNPRKKFNTIILNFAVKIYFLLLCKISAIITNDTNDTGDG